MPFNDREFIENGKWHTCCLKRKPKDGEKTRATGYAAFGVITSNRAPYEVFLRDMGDGAGDFAKSEEYQSLDALLEAGWIVD